MSKIPKLYAFLDTNIFLEYQEYDQIAWPRILNAKEVCLVIAPMVRQEIENHRTDTRSPRRQKKARSISPKLRDLVLSVNDGEEVDVPERPNVSLLELSQSPDLSRYSGLQPYVQDDHIIASVLDFQAAHPERTIMLVTGDTGLLMKARSRSIQRKYLDEYKLPDEPNPEHKRIRELQKEITQLKQTHPILDIDLIGAKEGVLTLTSVTSVEDVKKRKQTEILEVVDDLKTYLRQQKDSKSEFAAPMSELARPVSRFRPLNMDDDLHVELKQGLWELGISSFNEDILKPSNVYEEVGGLAGILRKQLIFGAGADWYRTVLKLLRKIRQAQREIHNALRQQQYKQLEVSVENLGSVTADELEISVTTSSGRHILASSLDKWYLFDPSAVHPYIPTDPLGSRPRKEWIKGELQREQELRTSFKAVKPGETLVEEIGYAGVFVPSRQINLFVRAVGRNLPQPVELTFAVQAE